MKESDLQLADLIFVRGDEWLDLPVKLVTRSQYTHVAGYVGMDKVIEAQGLRKTGYQALHKFKGACDVYRCPSLDLGTAQRIVAFAHSQVGTRYDYLLLVWEFVRHTFGILLPHVKSNRRICSTLWADAYKSAGLHLNPKVQYPTPADLVKSRYLRKIGSF